MLLGAAPSMLGDVELSMIEAKGFECFHECCGGRTREKRPLRMPNDCTELANDQYWHKCNGRKG